MEPTLTLVRFFPYWALPVAFVFAEVGLFARRHQRRGLDLAAFGVALCLVILTGLWLFKRGDLYAMEWVMRWHGIR